MADALNNQGFDNLLRNIGSDATATFDNSPSNPTEHASSEATSAATAVDGDQDDDELEEEDDDAAAEEEDDEDNEEEDVEDEAGV
ncbi:hypothetical protein RBB75_08740 [Tunturibacter empetritectus]|uniref:Uncharacterized protein n=1 Tax=Tunturiibacter empetritectus TaxID=3069691 RepID=A0AAU7ZHM5_9BACT